MAKIEDDDTRKALELAGKLAVATSAVVHAKAIDLGDKIVKLKRALQDYDDHMVEWHNRVRGRWLFQRAKRSKGGTE